MSSCAYNYSRILWYRVIPAYILPQHLLLPFEAEDQMPSGEPGRKVFSDLACANREVISGRVCVEIVGDVAQLGLLVFASHLRGL